MEKSSRSCPLDGTGLKWIAVTAMVIDHVGAVLFSDAVWLRCVGRIAFPIFAFLLVEGFFYTKNLRSYQGRILALALISEIPYDLALHGTLLEFGGQNIFFTLFFALVSMDIMAHGRFPFADIAGLLVGCLGALALSADYGPGGVLMVLCFYVIRSNPLPGWCCFFALNFLFFGSKIQWCAAFAAVFIWMYSGRRGEAPGNGKFFYWIYPVHLLILYAVSAMG